MEFLILNGPNLNLLGRREPDVYGQLSFDEYLPILKEAFTEHVIHYIQSNVEGELINALHDHGFDRGGIAFNPGGYTHTSVALGDAIRGIEVPVVEVHLSNVYARETFRHTSYTAPHCVASIAGMGLYGYGAALEFLISGLG